MTSVPQRTIGLPRFHRAGPFADIQADHEWDTNTRMKFPFEALRISGSQQTHC